ncbi:Luciferase-like monooxygenase [Minicystis rosea]|nr:Luciferase-like monooxygenase [Minicystis rosea]
MTGRIPLSVLDLSPIPAGSSPGRALQNSIDLARHADALGLTRHWLAEHHNAGALACSAPEIMIGQIAAATTNLRVGSGGIMLPNHSPLKVAETFRVLSALFPGRIDLGIGRAPGTDPRTAAALRRSPAPPSAADISAQIDALCGYLDAETTPREPFSTSIIAAPMGVDSPDLWMLGSSDAGASFAAERGLGFAFAHHFNPHQAVEMMQAYRRDFRPSARRSTPYAILAVSVVCAESDAAAEGLASSNDLAGVRMAQGKRDLPLPSVEEALAHTYDEDEENLRLLHREWHVVGGVDRVRETLRALVEATGADELMVMTHVHDHAARLRSYTLLAEAMKR